MTKPKRPAEDKQLTILAHVDDLALDLLMGSPPSKRQKLEQIWAHIGMGGDGVERVSQLMRSIQICMANHRTAQFWCAVLGSCAHRGGLCLKSILNDFFWGPTLR